MQTRNALVIGASGGVGAALLAALRAQPGWQAVGLARPDFDLTDEASIAAAASRIEGRLHLIIAATGRLMGDGMAPEKRLADITPQRLAASFAVNAIGPALLLKHFAPLLARDEPASFALLSARVGSIGDNGLGGWYGYRASKAALNQIIRCASIELARTHKLAKILALHPGTVQTALTRPVIGAERGEPPAVAAAMLLRVIAEAPASGIFLDQHGKPVPW